MLFDADSAPTLLPVDLVNEAVSHTGVWGLAAVMIVIASWVLYRYLATNTWRELYRARKEKRLATDGLYALVRHPQYTGLFIGLSGEGIVHWPTLFPVALFSVIVLVYRRLACSEERHVLVEIGDQYRVYMSHVPMFVPRLRQWGEFLRESNSNGGEQEVPLH